MLKRLIVILLFTTLTFGFSMPSFAADSQYSTTGKLSLLPDATVENPLDPMNPNENIEPQDPGSQGTAGPLSIDVATNFNFGVGKVSTDTMIYKAFPTKVKTGDGQIVERPNYVQVTDKRGGQKGWTLSITQEHQFRTDTGKELMGAELKITNIETVGKTGTFATAPSYAPKEVLLRTNQTVNIPILAAKPDEGGGTWIARFGNLDTMDESVQLLVLGTIIQEADTYTTSLLWSLSSIPANSEK